MKTLTDVAAGYDHQAQTNEALAHEILAQADSLPAEVREGQRWRASWLITEAARLKARAAELRGIEWLRSTN